MLDGRVKVDVVADLHRHAHFSPVARHEEAIGVRVAQARVAVGAQQQRESFPQRSPNRTTRRKQRIEPGRRQQLALAKVVGETRFSDRR